MRGAAHGSVRLAVFVIFALGLTGLLIAYTLVHRRPLIPADPDHARSLEPVRCLDCHGPTGKNRRGKNHPLNDQCFSCHERA